MKTAGYRTGVLQLVLMFLVKWFPELMKDLCLKREINMC